MLKIADKEVSQKIQDVIKLKFGTEIGGSIITALGECINLHADRTSIVNCVIDKLEDHPTGYSEPLKQEIWDFLYHFVIVG